MKLTTLTGNPVFVNKDNIVYFTPLLDDSNRTMIHLTNQKFISVREPFDVVVKRFTDTGITVELQEFR